MATCYDCIHCGACSDAGDSGFSCLKEDVSKCEQFKNKADFAEVVRCGDCKYYRKYLCVRPHGPASVLPNDFCSRGKIKQ